MKQNAMEALEKAAGVRDQQTADGPSAMNSYL
jgi:hypothetical protein